MKDKNKKDSLADKINWGGKNEKKKEEKKKGCSKSSFPKLRDLLKLK